MAAIHKMPFYEFAYRACAVAVAWDRVRLGERE